MKSKTFEIRDSATFIPALAFRLDPSSEADRYLMARAGFGRTILEQSQYIILWRMNGGNGTAVCDPYDWGNRTMQNAHMYIIQNFENLESGSVIDVEHILGETSSCKTSERLDSHYG